MLKTELEERVNYLELKGHNTQVDLAGAETRIEALRLELLEQRKETENAKERERAVLLNIVSQMFSEERTSTNPDGSIDKLHAAPLLDKDSQGAYGSYRDHTR